LPNPVSLKQITGKDFDPAAMGRELCQALENRFQALQAGHIDAIMQQYQQVLYKLNQPVTLKKGAILFETTIKGVADNGRLLTKDVMEREFDFGEVEMIIR
jgi:BirA family biotin operon repressor/biotin-[acetyl-CoA-carboxylase] ligase